MVIVDLPEAGDVIDAGLKLTVTPAGWPVADKATAELKPPVTDVVMGDVPDLPCVTLTDVGDAESVKPGGAVTVSDTVAVLVMPPLVPVTVIV